MKTHHATSATELCATRGDCQDAALTGDPFQRLCYVYGQLLGASDLTAEQTAIQLRRRLHQAALHGAGVVWGLDVTLRDEGRGIVVGPGLAVDALGRDVYVDQEQCLDVRRLAANEGFWAQLDSCAPTAPPVSAPRAEPAGDSTPAGATTTPATSTATTESSESERVCRRAYVVLRFQACKSQPAPSLRSTCRDEDQALDYSRLHDSFVLELSHAAPQCPHDLVRVASAGRASPDRRTLRSLREQLLDLELQQPRAPLSDLWSNPEARAPVLLAAVDLIAHRVDGQLSTRVDRVHVQRRPLLPAVQVLAELSTGHTLACPESDLGMRALRVRGRIEGGATVIEVDLSRQPLASTASSAVTLSFLDVGGWRRIEPNVDVQGTRLIVTVAGEEWVDDSVYQLVLAGAGPTPMLDTERRPLAGWADEPLPPPGRGRDASLTAIWPPSAPQENE